MSTHDQHPEISWHSEHFDELLHRTLEGEIFVFNPLTGHTHILNQLSWKLLSACAERQRSSEDLVGLLDLEQAQVGRQEIEGHIWQLQQLELIQAQNPCN